MYCATIVLLLLNGSQWEFRDLNDFKRAATSCKTRYNSCLSKFVKVKKDTYRAICK